MVTETYADGVVRVTGMDRTLVDVLADPDYGGSWDEIYQSVTRADQIDVETVAAYCQLRDGGPALRAKVGFFLDQHRGLWGIDNCELDQFRPRIGAQLSISTQPPLSGPTTWRSGIWWCR